MTTLADMLDYLEEEGLAENTIVVYTSDQGFFLGDHGWYDKRFMYEESLRMPLLIRYPRRSKPAHGRRSDGPQRRLHADPARIRRCRNPGPLPGDQFLFSIWQGTVARRLADLDVLPLLDAPGHHHVYAHYGVRTLRYKLIYYYADGLDQPGVIDESKEPEWELFDLDSDPYELNNVYSDPAYADVVEELTEELHRLQARVDDEPYDHPRLRPARNPGGDGNTETLEKTKRPA